MLFDMYDMYGRKTTYFEQSVKYATTVPYNGLGIWGVRRIRQILDEEDQIKFWKRQITT